MLPDTGLLSLSGADPEKEPEPVYSLRGSFTNELRSMMYGFGDDATPVPESINLVEDILTDYIQTTTHKAVSVAAVPGKVTVEDMMYTLRQVS